jgi:5-methylthioadenosine/S-adenosylhomocysteine deaminase
MRLCFLILLSSLLLRAAEPADVLITARQVVTMDADRRVIANGAVAIHDGKIAAVGPRAEVETRYRPRQRVDRPDALLIPGLVNTHTHAPMSLLRGIADDLRLQDWLEHYIFPAEAKNVSEEFVRVGTRLAVLEMMLGGTTTYTDMYYFEDAIAEETAKAGMRGVLGQTIIGFPAPDYKTPAEALAGTRRFLERFRNHPLITPAVAPHAIYTNSLETLQAAARLANEYSVPMLIHVSETRKENQDAAAQHGASPAAYLDKIGAVARRSVYAHAVWTDATDHALLAARRVGVAHCPGSNMKLASGAAPVAAMLRAGIAVGLGSDGPAGSNNDFSMFEEMDLAAKLAKVTSLDPEALPAPTVFAMATITGARALGMEKEIGSIEPGKRADLVTVSLAAPHAWPSHDVYSMLVYTLKTSDVLDVMIDGRWTVRDRRPLTLDAAAIRRSVAEWRAKVEASMPKR